MPETGLTSPGTPNRPAASRDASRTRLNDTKHLPTPDRGPSRRPPTVAGTSIGVSKMSEASRVSKETRWNHDEKPKEEPRSPPRKTERIPMRVQWGPRGTEKEPQRGGVPPKERSQDFVFFNRPDARRYGTKCTKKNENERFVREGYENGIHKVHLKFLKSTPVSHGMLGFKIRQGVFNAR